jgi:lysophospholipase L1-like esterase
MPRYNLKKRTVFVSIVVLLAVVASLFLAEIYVRIFREYITPAILLTRSLEYESSLFARYVFPLKEQRIAAPGYFINQKGHRGKDFSRKKGDGIVRLIVYGGSAAFDQNVPEGKDWPHRIEGLFHEKGLRHIEVINAGIPGNATFDSLGRFLFEGHIFEPDYVLLYNAWNDIKYFSFEVPLLRMGKPQHEKGDPRTHYKSVVDEALCEFSQLYVRLRGRYYHWKYQIGKEGTIKSGEFTRNINELGLKQYRLNIEMFVDLARNIGAVPVLITQARLFALENTEKEKNRIAYGYQRMNHRTLLSAFEETDEVIKQVAHSKHVHMIDASKRLSGKGEYFSDHVHLNHAGSDQLAIVISEFLLPLVMNQVPPSQ